MSTFLFRVPQKAVINEDNKFLILKRSPNAAVYPNHWDLPGGRLESGEDMKRSLEREVKEETGLKIKIMKPIFTFRETINNHHEAVFLLFSCKKISLS
jgi:8-oxo-dGTP diphosphatase